MILKLIRKNPGKCSRGGFLMTLAGSLVPSLRELRVDPITAIRAE
jgi:hypothetical protein